MAILDRLVQRTPRHLRSVPKVDPLAYLNDQDQALAEAKAAHPSSAPLIEGTATVRRLGQFGPPDPMGGRTSLDDPREDPARAEERRTLLDKAQEMEGQQLQDILGAGLILISFLFLFIGIWVWFGFGVGLTTLGLGLFGVGAWLVWSNHRPEVIVVNEQQKPKRKIKN